MPIKEDMKHRKKLLFTTIFITLAALFLIISSPGIMLYNLSSSYNFPAGTLITWFGFLGLSLSVYLGIANLRNPKKWWNTILSYQLRITLIIAALWVAISYVLAGNLSFTFTDKVAFQGGQMAMKIFWVINYSLVIVPILILFSYWILNKLKP